MSGGRLVAVVGAHGGAGATTVAEAVASGAGVGACLIDLDLAGGDARSLVGLEGDVASVGLAADAVDAGALARRTAFGWFVEAAPRPELAWLIRDGAAGELVRSALALASLVVVDAGRPLGPSCEPVVDADVVLVVAHASRPDRLDLARRRLQRLGVDDERLVDCPTAPTAVDRLLGRLRGSARTVDAADADELLLLVEGRIAAVGSRSRP